MTRSDTIFSVLNVTVSRRVRAVAAVWGLLFVANALLSPALCQQFRHDTAEDAARRRPDATVVAASHASHQFPAEHGTHANRHAHHGQGAPRPSAPATDQGRPTAHPSDATCDFCVLASAADTSSPAEIAVPADAPLKCLATCTLPAYATAAVQPSIRAPPLAS